MGNFSRIVVGFGIFAAAVAHSLAERKGANSGPKPGTRSLEVLIRHARTKRRKPPEAGVTVPAITPRGPLPKQGGAAALLDFEA